MARDPWFAAGPLRVRVHRCTIAPEDLGEGLRVQRAARETWRRKTGITWTRWRTHVWVLMLRGQLRLDEVARSRVAAAGTLVAIPPGCGYRLLVEGESDADLLIWNATGATADAWLPGDAGASILDLRRRRAVEHAFAEAFDRLLASSAQERALARHYLAAAIGLACLPGDALEAPRRAARQAQRCRDLIDHASGGHRTVAALAAALGLNEDYLSRIYRARFGVAPGADLRRRRLEQAAALLADPGRDLAGIAAELGYADSFAFSKAFKAYAGLSPRHWRAQFTLG